MHAVYSFQYVYTKYMHMNSTVRHIWVAYCTNGPGTIVIKASANKKAILVFAI